MNKSIVDSSFIIAIVKKALVMCANISDARKQIQHSYQFIFGNIVKFNTDAGLDVLRKKAVKF